MMTFKQFLDELDTMREDMAVNNIAGSGATHIARFDPLLRSKLYRRKPQSDKTK